MAITGYNESSLGTSEVFKQLNEYSKLQEKAVQLIKTAKHLTPDDIEIAYIGVKSISDGFVRESIKYYEAGKIVLLYAGEPSLAMSQALPFITFKGKDGNYTTYVFMDKYITKNRDNVLQLDTVKLRDLLQSALVANILKTKYTSLSSNEFLTQLITRLYFKFVSRILNRQFAIGADVNIMDTIEYWCNRFFLEQILMVSNTPENIELMATKGLRYIDELKIGEIKDQYNKAMPRTIVDILELMSTATPRMASLSYPTFLPDWINYYYAPSTLAIDNIEYLIFMIITLLTGSGIISIPAGEIVRNDKHIKSFKTELYKLIVN